MSYETSFKSCSAGHQGTTSVILQADSHRHAIKKNMADGKLSHAALSKALQEYMYVLILFLLCPPFQSWYISLIRIHFGVPSIFCGYVALCSLSFLQTVDQPDTTIM